MRRFGDADLAEESVQEAFTRAAARWPADGVPDSPLGWVVATAGNVQVITGPAGYYDVHSTFVFAHA